LPRIALIKLHSRLFFLFRICICRISTLHIVNSGKVLPRAWQKETAVRTTITAVLLTKTITYYPLLLVVFITFTTF